MRKQVLSELRDEIEEVLTHTLSPTHIEILDESAKHAGHAGAASGGSHFRALLVAQRFTGLSQMARQRLVYAALSPWMGNRIHAFTMRTVTPDEWSK